MTSHLKGTMTGLVTTNKAIHVMNIKMYAESNLLTRQREQKCSSQSGKSGSARHHGNRAI